MTNNKAKTLIVILGATATGKTAVSIELARKTGSEIISSDSRQVYREMVIGTAKPAAAELAAVPHHMVSVKSVAEYYSSGQYEQDAMEIITRLFEKHDTLFLVGGSGLYIDAVCHGMDDMPETDHALRETLTERAREEGLRSLLDELKTLDPQTYGKIDRSNPQRVIRALEVTLQTGRPYSRSRSGKHKERLFDTVKVGLTMPRELLYDRINRRVDEMMSEGLEEEARRLYPMRHCNALQTVGYKEFFGYFDGEATLEEAVGLIKRNTRRYAKRQITWFGRDDSVKWFDMTEATVADIENYLKVV